MSDSSLCCPQNGLGFAQASMFPKVDLKKEFNQKTVFQQNVNKASQLFKEREFTH